ncbi:MAG TPA: 5'-3' exonuclease H3TH domain-containing protein, partial [Allosphingosinicella sp.]|nr:5'-3' exonuclease H3TH domain-containing protein [Allosphingosinicella sp.]
MPSPHLYLVDGSSYIFRAFHRLPPLTNRHGLNVGAVYGYTTMLWKLADGLNRQDGPTHLAVILDASESTFRNQMYDGYKANRPPPPPELVPQFPLIRDATRAFSIPCLEQDGLEADDIIACYSKAALEKGWKVTIVSSDKDLMQLIEPGLDMLDTMNDRRIDRDYVIEKFGVPPEQLGDVLALMGDSVDNVPGVPGVGPKTASQLIQQYGDVEGVLAHVDEIAKPKLKQNLIEHAEAARMSRELVRLVCDAPLPQPLDELAIQGIPKEPLQAFLEEQGFRTLLARLGAQQMASAPAPSHVPTQREVRPEPKIDRSAYETVIEEAALDRWIAEASAKGLVAVDTETDGRDCVTAKLVGISLATECGRACYIPLEHGGHDLLSDRPDQLPAALV